MTSKACEAHLPEVSEDFVVGLVLLLVDLSELEGGVSVPVASLCHTHTHTHIKGRAIKWCSSLPPR